MHKGILWALAGLVAIAGGAYIALGTGKQAPAAQGTASSTLQMSLRELAAGTSPRQCAFSGDDGSKGTAYVDSGRVRGDFSAQIGGRQASGHFIIKDGTGYVWMEGMAQGFKNSFEATSTASTTQGGLSADERMPFSCRGWSPDENAFALPSGIMFEAVGAAEVKAGAAAAGASCAQCGRISDANAKAQCLAVLHC